MRRRDFLAGTTVLCLGGLPATAAFSRDDTLIDDRGRGRGRGSDDLFGDHGGGSGSGHGSIEERAAAIGDGRADRAESRLREELKSEGLRDRGLVHGDGRRGALAEPVHADGAASSGGRVVPEQDRLSRFVDGFLDLFGTR